MLQTLELVVQSLEFVVDDHLRDTPTSISWSIDLDFVVYILVLEVRELVHEVRAPELVVDHLALERINHQILISATYRDALTSRS